MDILNLHSRLWQRQFQGYVQVIYSILERGNMLNLLKSTVKFQPENLGKNL